MWSDNAMTVLKARYLKGTETPGERFRAVAAHVASAEERNQGDWTGEFFAMMVDHEFLPNTPCIANAGRGHGQLNACFVLPVEDALTTGRDTGIMDTARNTALIHQTGGGTGFDFSRIRPKGEPVASSNGVASGPVSFLRLYDAVTDTIKQGGIRRGANMGILRVDHPDIREFITSKMDEVGLNNFNISVAITDEFMWRVVNGDPEACSLWQLICNSAWTHGDPGLFFVDEANRANPLYPEFPIRATNPCVVGQTRIATSRGLVRVDELFEAHEPLQVVADRRGAGAGLGIDLRAAVPMFKTADNAEVFRVVTSHGYEVTATGYHKFVTQRGRVELRDLVAGDTLFVQSEEGGFGAEGSLKLGRVLGCISGDGCITGGRAILDFWGPDADDYGRDVIAMAQAIVAEEPTFAPGRGYGPGVVLSVPKQGKIRFQSVRLARFLGRLGVTGGTKLRVPEAVWRGSRDMVVGYLQGLFSSDGTVNVSSQKRSCSVRLSQSDETFLKEVQLLLSNFGIVSKVMLRRDSGTSMLPDGRGGSAAYPTKAQYELIIDGQSRDRFSSEVGFLNPRKQAKLSAFISGKARRSNSERFVTEVASIEPAGRAAVYDTTEPETHTITVGGLVTGQCGEIPMPDNDACNLGSINLGGLVLDKSFDFYRFSQLISLGIRFLDDVVTVNEVPVSNIQAFTQQTRRLGLGVMGWADFLNRMEIPYDSERAIEWAETLAMHLRDTALATSYALAVEKGAYPLSSSGERRNVALLSIAPTGSISTIAGCSAGIEPYFSRSVTRTVAVGVLEEHYENSDKPWFRTAMEIDPVWHVLHQAAWQKYIDNGVSKTVNLRNTATPQDVEAIYRMAWVNKLKGITIYRSGSRSEQVYNQIPDKLSCAIGPDGNC